MTVEDSMDDAQLNRPGVPAGEDDLLILMPVFNDWNAASLLLLQIDQLFLNEKLAASVLLIDDGSTTGPSPGQFNRQYQAVLRVDVLKLRRNLGHQRAICIGLSHLSTTFPVGRVVVMDSDGEDDPRDIPRLLERFEAEGRKTIVFAERAKRSENLLFRVFYRLYCGLHRFLVGHRVRVGNFSVIPADRLKSLAVVPELWNHYAAAVFGSRQPYCAVPTHRSKRIAGNSKMNFIALVTHGLGALSAFSDRIGVRMLVMASAFMVLLLFGIVGVVALRLTTDMAIPGWATYTAGLLGVMLFQTFSLLVIFCFIILSARMGGTFLPARDYCHFVDRLESLYTSRDAL